MAKLPLGFERNVGQTDARVLYLARAAGYTLFLTRTGAVVSLAEPSRSGSSRDGLRTPARELIPRSRGTRASAVRIDFQGASPAAQVIGVDALAGRVNYFVGKDPERWRTDVPTFDRVRYSAIYPGVDLVFYGSNRALECDFIVAPGANPDAIRLSLAGADARIDAAGNLSLRAGGAELTLRKPIIYQQNAQGERSRIDGHYVLSRSPNHHEAAVGVALASYDRAKPLVIDPQLVYSSYLGGTFGSQGTAIAVSNGLIYLTGRTISADFPLSSNAFEPAPGFIIVSDSGEHLQNVAFATILNPAASGSAQLVYSTLLGGTQGYQQGNAISVGPRGTVYVTGFTNARNFPVTSSAFQTSTASSSSIFLSVLDPAATGSAQLVYSTYMGGAGEQSGTAIAVDSRGLAYIAGSTSAIDFPVTSNAFQLVNKPTNGSTAFVDVFDPSASGVDSIVYSTLLGGSTAETVNGIALAPNGAIYLTGVTESTDFPVTRGGFQSRAAPGASSDAFFTVLNPALRGAAQLAYSTYIGGFAPQNPETQGNAVAADAQGFALVTGTTTSSNFPVTTNAIQRASKTGGGSTVFVSKFDPSKSGAQSLVFSTFFGGSSSEQGNGIAVDSRGFAYITGTTSSSDFPITKGAFTTLPGEGTFLSVIDPGVHGKMPALVYSSFLGGLAFAGGNTQASAIAVDSKGVAYMTGTTSSTTFPVTSNALQPALPKLFFGDAFVAVLDPSQALQTASASLNAAPAQVKFSDQFFGGSGVTSPQQALVLSHSGRGQSAPIAVEGIQVQNLDPSLGPEFAIVGSATTCTLGLSLTPGTSCSVALTFTPGKAGNRSGTLTIADNAQNAPQKIMLLGKGLMGPLEVGPAQVDFGGVPINDGKQHRQFVTLTNNNPGPVALTRIQTSGSNFFVRLKDFLAACRGGRSVLVRGRIEAAVPANGSCQVPVLFFPTATGKASGTLTITDLAANSPQTVQLKGVGLPATPAPTPIPGPTPIPKP